MLPPGKSIKDNPTGSTTGHVGTAALGCPGEPNSPSKDSLNKYISDPEM
jgi:hypothetical protein